MFLLQELYESNYTVYVNPHTNNQRFRHEEPDGRAPPGPAQPLRGRLPFLSLRHHHFFVNIYPCPSIIRAIRVIGSYVSGRLTCP